MKKRVLVLGSTGSIGASALKVLRRLPDELEATALVGGANWRLLLEQARELRPQAVGLGDAGSASAFAAAFRSAPWEPEPVLYAGNHELVRLVRETPGDIVLAAISGSAGLPAVIAALESGKHLALANKEALVMAGAIVLRKARERGLRLLPVDSEHSAIFQSLHAGQPREVRRVVLTASGGPFRAWTAEAMASITPEQALQHPTWKMGAKITIDSATLMNKALEIIEAHWLFGLPPERIDVVIHPQSIIHSAVDFCDGSSICQLGLPDMQIPIQYALTYPERRAIPGTELDLAAVGQLSFETPDRKRFPSLDFAHEAVRRGSTAPAVLNAANEVAVDLFLKGRLSFLRIFEVVGKVLAAHRTPADEPQLETVLAADRWAREEVRSRL